MRFAKNKKTYHSKPQRLRAQAIQSALSAGKSRAEAEAAGDAAFASFDKAAWDEEKRRRFPRNYDGSNRKGVVA